MDPAIVPTTFLPGGWSGGIVLPWRWTSLHLWGQSRAAGVAVSGGFLSTAAASASEGQAVCCSGFWPSGQNLVLILKAGRCQELCRALCSLQGLRLCLGRFDC